MLLMVQKGIRGGICRSIYRYSKSNNKYMKHCDKNREPLHLKYRDVSNLYGWAISQKLPLNNFEWTEDIFEFNEDFIKHYNEESDEGHFLEVDVQYPKELHELHTDLPFLPERIEIAKTKKLVFNLYYKTENVIHIRNLKNALNYGLVF